MADECKCERGLVKTGGKKGKVEVRRSLRFEEQDPHLSSSHVKQRKKDKLIFFFFFEKKEKKWTPIGRTWVLMLKPQNVNADL